jgi:DNA-binding response OmpR family regulator
MYDLLLVEDNKEIQEMNKDLLESYGGYTVRLAMNLAEAHEQIAKSMPDVIVLDIMLPDGSGLDFLQELRQGANIPVLLLTALGESNYVVKGLKSGGDDYLAKPYNNDILLARIESLLRRTAQVPKAIIKGSLTLDIFAGRAFLEGENRDLHLTQKEFAVLLLLVQNEGKTMRAETIYKNVWKQSAEIDTNTLQATLSNVRKKIEPSGCAINVSRGQGYTFIAK